MRWQPIAMAATMRAAIEEEVHVFESLMERLRPVVATPHVLDDATVDRVVAMCERALELAPVHEAQSARWQDANATPQQQRDAEGFAKGAARNKFLAQELLGLAQQLREGTIDRIVGLSDQELGLAYLSGRIRPPRG